MAKKYEFVLKAVKAKFEGPFASIEISAMFNGNELAAVPVVGTLAEALEQRKAEAVKLNQDAAWFIEMKNRNEKKPAGFKAAKQLYYSVANGLNEGFIS